MTDHKGKVNLDPYLNILKINARAKYNSSVHCTENTVMNN